MLQMNTDMIIPTVTSHSIANDRRSHHVWPPNNTNRTYVFILSISIFSYRICLAWSFACCALNFAGRH